MTEGAGDLSDEEIDRIVRELLRQNRKQTEKDLSSWESFKKFLENAGLMYLMRKVGDVIENVLVWLGDIILG